MEPAGDGLYQEGFIAGDDRESLRLKARYVREHGLAGAMFSE